MPGTCSWRGPCSSLQEKRSTLSTEPVEDCRKYAGLESCDAATQPPKVGSKDSGALDSNDVLAPRLAVRGGHRLRLGRGSLTRVDREHNHRPYRQKLTLPVLERLDPETRGAQVLEYRNGVRAVLHLLLAVSWM